MRGSVPWFALAALGALLPYGVFWPFLQAEGVDLLALWAQVSASPGSQFFAMDVLVSALVLALWILSDPRPVSRSRRLACLLGLGLVGVSFALPLFLGFRAQTQEKGGAAP